MKKNLVAVAGLLVPCAGYAAGVIDEPAYFGIDITPEYIHQSFDRGEADLYTVYLAPYVQKGAWELGLELPWQHIEGEYFINRNRPPSASYFCQWVNNGGPLLQRWLERHGLTAGQINYCMDNAGQFADNPSQEVSGWGDAQAALRYGRALTADGQWYGGLSLSYKFDNGDAEDGLGSGTRDTRLGASLKTDIGKVSLLSSAGYTWINGDDDIDYLNYADATADIALRLNRLITVGSNWAFQETSVEYLDEDVESLTAYIDVTAGKRSYLNIFYTDYLDVQAYPDTEYGASVTWAF